MSGFGEDLEQRLVGASVTIIRRQPMWDFEFSTGLRLYVQTDWRLRDARCIQLTDADDGHQYGLPARIDAQARGNDLLSGCRVTEATMDDITGDLKITFSNGTILEVLTSSTGYESWQAYVDGEFWAVGGNGGLR